MTTTIPIPTSPHLESKSDIGFKAVNPLKYWSSPLLLGHTFELNFRKLENTRAVSI